MQSLGGHWLGNWCLSNWNCCNDNLLIGFLVGLPNLASVGRGSRVDQLCLAMRDICVSCLFCFVFFWLSWVLVAAPSLSRSVACRILVPQPGIESVSPALQDRFFFFFFFRFTYNTNTLLTADHPGGPRRQPRHPAPSHKFSAASEPLALTPTGWARRPRARGLSRFGWWSSSCRPWILRAPACSVPENRSCQHLGDPGKLDGLHTARVHDGGAAAVGRRAQDRFLTTETTGTSPFVC